MLHMLTRAVSRTGMGPSALRFPALVRGFALAKDPYENLEAKGTFPWHELPSSCC